MIAFLGLGALALLAMSGHKRPKQTPGRGLPGGPASQGGSLPGSASDPSRDDSGAAHVRAAAAAWFMNPAPMSEPQLAEGEQIAKACDAKGLTDLAGKIRARCTADRALLQGSGLLAQIATILGLPSDELPQAPPIVPGVPPSASSPGSLPQAVPTVPLTVPGLGPVQLPTQIQVPGLGTLPIPGAGVAIPGVPVPAPVIPLPVGPAPVIPLPVTPAPVTPAPVTPAPVTPAAAADWTPGTVAVPGVTVAPYLDGDAMAWSPRTALGAAWDESALHRFRLPDGSILEDRGWRDYWRHVPAKALALSLRRDLQRGGPEKHNQDLLRVWQGRNNLTPDGLWGRESRESLKRMFPRDEWSTIPLHWAQTRAQSKAAGGSS